MCILLVYTLLYATILGIYTYALVLFVPSVTDYNELFCLYKGFLGIILYSARSGARCVLTVEMLSES